MTTHLARAARRGALLGCAAAAAGLAACGAERGVRDITAADPGAHIKFFNFGVGTPGVNFYANDTKITAISSTSGAESTTGTAAGAAAANGLYSGLAPGQYTFTGRIAAATDKDLTVASVAATLENGRSYSYYVSGIYNTATKQADAFVVEDGYPATIVYDSVYVRLVNAVSNAGPLALSFRVTPASGPVFEVPIGAAVAYKGATPFVPLPGGGIVDLVVRNAGSTAAAITRTGVSFALGRVYTVTARGDITVTSTTSANRPQLDNTLNR